jgi:hypothetical protein
MLTGDQVFFVGFKFRDPTSGRNRRSNNWYGSGDAHLTGGFERKKYEYIQNSEIFNLCFNVVGHVFDVMPIASFGDNSHFRYLN